MKSSSLISKEICGWKDSFEGLSSVKGKSYFNGIALKSIFDKYDILNVNKSEITDELNSTMRTEVFGTKEEADLNRKLLTEKLLRYQLWERKFSSKKKFRKAGTTSIFIGGNEIKVDYHFIKIDEDNKTVTVCKVRNKKNPLKPSGRTAFTSIKKNKELFLLQAVGRLLYPSYESFGCLVFLTHSSDSGEEVSSDFELKSGENVVSKTYDTFDINEMEDSISKIISSSVKACNKNGECDTCSYRNICNYVHRDLSKLKVIPPIAKASGKVSFTGSQLEFIEFNKGIVRVLAGAGSGKTTVIANNVVEMLRDGILPQDIILITFTTKGVSEIKEKIAYWIKKESLTSNVNDLNIFTFNSFGYELIKNEYKRLGYTAVPEVLDKMEQVSILKDVLDMFPYLKGFNYVHPFMDLPYSKGVVIKLGQIFSEIKRLGISFDSEVEDEFNLDNATAMQILLMYKKYNDILKSKNYIEFNDQVPMAYELLSNKDILDKYGYGHIICDEFQDSDSLQINLLALLRSYKYNMSLAVCGDDSQSIFGWRGADQTNIVNFQDYFPGVKDIEMTKNFRSTNEICKLANYIDALNENSIKKNISSDKSGSKPTLLAGDSSTIMDLVKKDILVNKINPHDIAVISRNKKALIDANNKLESLNIPSLIAVSEILIDNPKVKNLIGFSNFLLDDTLDYHLAEYLQIIKNKEFEKAKLGDFKKFIDKEKLVFMAKYSACKTDVEQLEFFFKILNEISKEDKAVMKFTSIILSKNFKSMKALVGYLNNLILYKADYFIEKSEDIYDAVTLTTAHSSKGKEFKKVYIDLSNFKFNEKDDEIIRLLFVAITRAKEELVIVGNVSNVFYKEIAGYLKSVS